MRFLPPGSRLCEEVARRGRPEILDEVSPLVLLGDSAARRSARAAVARRFDLSHRIRPIDTQVTAAAAAFGVSPEQVLQLGPIARLPGIRKPLCK